MTFSLEFEGSNTLETYSREIFPRIGEIFPRKTALSVEAHSVRSPLAEGPFFNGTLVPRIQLAILKTSKIMSWPRLARPRDLVGSLVWRGDDRATEIFFLFTLE